MCPKSVSMNLVDMDVHNPPKPIKKDLQNGRILGPNRALEPLECPFTYVRH